MPIVNDTTEQTFMNSSITPADTLDTLGALKINPTVTTVKHAEISITDPGVTTIVHDTRTAEITTVLTYAEGAAWSVDYYSQVLSKDSELTGLQVALNGVHQQYSLIKNLELKVTQPLSSSQNQEDSSMKVDGAATVVASLIPNPGDMFTADIENVSKAVFRVNTVAKASIFKSSVYQITYTLLNDYEATLLALDKKVVTTYYYHKDFLVYGKDPLILKEKHYVLIRLHQAYKEVMRYYFSRFFSNEFHTLIAPTEGQFVVYDPFLVNFVLANFDTNEAPELQYVRGLNLDEDPACKSDSLYTAILKRDPTVLLHSFTTAGLVNANAFVHDPRFASLRYLGIEKVVYPVDPMRRVDNDILTKLKPTSMDAMTKPVSKPSVSKLAQLVVPTNRPAEGAVDLYEVTHDSYYVFSEYFYKNTVEKMSLFEQFIRNYLDRKSFDGAVLLRTALKDYKLWKPLEQFYILPIFLVVLRAAMNEPNSVNTSSELMDLYYLYMSESNGIDIDVDAYLATKETMDADVSVPFDFFKLYQDASSGKTSA